MATQEEKNLKKEEKELKKIAKAERKLEKIELKEQEKVKKNRVKVLMSRARDERKPAKRAARALNKERDRRTAMGRVQKVRKNFAGLPPSLWPLMAVVAYIWGRNSWEKERQARDLREARRFLKETRDLR
ncbi:MAG: hypothetical protein JWP00_2131 [Chloroflexi bacterium]|nr:hypothetical protein [Chloroflexota bacterium]